MPIIVATFSLDLLQPAIPSDDAIEFPVKLAQGTYAKGQVLGEVSATPGVFKAYASGNSDGSEDPKAVLRYGCTVASDGTISGLTEHGEVLKSVPAYFGDVTLRCADLAGLDANAVSAMGARVLTGDVSSGLIRIP